MILNRLSRKQNNILGIILIILAFFAFVFTVYTYLPVFENANPPYSWGWGVDWKNLLRQASIDTIKGHNPYTGPLRLLPPWAYLIVSPFTALSPELGEAVFFVLTYMVYAIVLYRLKAKPLAILAFLSNYFIFMNAKNGNLDFLVALGFIVPPQVGLFLVLIKPQIGFGIAIFWLIEAWRKGRICGSIKGLYSSYDCVSYFIRYLWILASCFVRRGTRSL